MPHALLIKAASICNEESYNRNAEESVQVASTKSFCMTGLLIRANCKHTGKYLLRFGDSKVLHEANMLVCRTVKAIHIRSWEIDKKPSWEDVKNAFIEASKLTFS